jgi:hypothetical protein
MSCLESHSSTIPLLTKGSCPHEAKHENTKTKQNKTIECETQQEQHTWSHGINILKHKHSICDPYTQILALLPCTLLPWCRAERLQRKRTRCQSAPRVSTHPVRSRPPQAPTGAKHHCHLRKDLRHQLDEGIVGSDYDAEQSRKDSYS